MARIDKQLCIITAFITFAWWGLHLHSRPVFFYWDEWSILRSLAYSDDFLNWLVQSHMGHVQFLGRLLYWLEIQAFSDSYGLFVATNILMHSANTGILCFLLLRVGVSRIAAVLPTLLYSLHFTQGQNLLWGMQSMLFVMLALLFFSLILTLRYLRTENLLPLSMSCFASFCTPFLFGIGLTTGPLNVIFATAITRSFFDQRLRRVLVAHLVSSILATITFAGLSSVGDQTSNHPGAVVDALDFSALPEIVARSDFQGFMYRGVLALPAEFLTLGFILDNYIVPTATVLLILSSIFSIRFSASRNVLFVLAAFLVANAVIMILPGLSRYTFGAHMAFAYRYQSFALIPSIGLLAAFLDSVLQARWRYSLPLVLVSLLGWHLTFNCMRTEELATRLSATREPFRTQYNKWVRSVSGTESDPAGIFNPALNPQLTTAELSQITERVLRPLHGPLDPVADHRS